MADRYLDRTDPEHPCHRGCSHIWNGHEQVWRCYRCGTPDAARPAPTELTPGGLEQFKMPSAPLFPDVHPLNRPFPQPWRPLVTEPGKVDPRTYTSPPRNSCYMCRDAQYAGKPLGLVCHCACHGLRVTC